MDVFQELSINTDIAYDLDMSMFPGLEDPVKQLQPALVVCTPEACQRWLSALQDDVSTNVSGSIDDLYDLIDICSLEMTLRGCTSDGGLLDRFLDDVFDSPSTDQADGCLGVSGFSLSDSGHFSSTTPDVQQSPDSNSDHELLGYTYTGCHGYSEVSCMKRKREADNPDSNKRLKVVDFVDIQCFSKSVYENHRDS